MNRETFEKLVSDRENDSYRICEKLTSKPVVVVPAGRLYKHSIRTLMDWDVSVIGVGDRNPESSLGNGKPWNYQGVDFIVEKTDELVKKHGNSVHYVVYSSYYRDEITKELLDYGINEYNIYTIPVIMGDLVPKHSFARSLEIKKNFDEIYESAQLLADEESRDQLWELMSVFCARTPVWLNKAASEEYFNTPYIALTQDEVFVDAGMYDGKTTERFVELCPKYKAIYGIEANPDSFEHITDNLKNYRDLHLYNNAISDASVELRFKRKGYGPEGAHLAADGELVVKGITGDELGIFPTFIKFDIEGAESAALRGFQATIRKCRPKMAVSAYHSLEDHWKLIKQIKEICPDYKIHLIHHYGYEVMYGTVLYANCD